jgi:peroxiredoxin/mono/diheme cytochrome c family protein
MYTALAVTLAALAAAPAEGTPVPSFTLPDQHRRPRSLDAYKDKKAVVVVFLGTECPLANLYVPTLAELHKEYAPRGVQFLAVNANPQDSFVAVAAHAWERGIPFPVLKDYDQVALAALGARRTPEAFVLDAGRVIRYRGRIDDRYGLNYRRDEPRRRDLKEALDEVLAGRPVTTPRTDAQGCVIGKPREPEVKGEITYAKHVAPIIQSRCQGCHRPGQVAPFALLTYDDARAWSDMIREVVREERMPPWHADPRYGKFANDRRLPREEADLLVAWVDQNCPKGDEKDLPPPAKFVEGWTIGKPDAVFEMKEAFTVPPTGVLPYKKFVVDPGFTEDRWVRAAEARPGNRAVVHHIIVYALAPGKREYEPDGTAAMLAGWAPGDMPAVYPKGVAKRVAAGSKLVFEVHYTPDGKEQTDRSSVGLIFAEEPPEYEAVTNILANLPIRIPPGKANHREEFTYTFPEDVKLLSFMPHMHLRGVSAKYVATFPDGKTETLLSVPDYDFGWQSVYRFADPVPIPKGTKLKWVGVWDNSADNPRNPDPTQEVRWGLQTWDEMHNGWMEVMRKRSAK